MGERLKVGDSVLGRTITKIVTFGKARKMFENWKGDEGFLSGANLQDNPNYKERSDPKAIYIFRKPASKP